MKVAKFKKVYIEITNLCNLKCSFCPGTERVPQIMSPELFNKCCQEVKSFTNYIYLHVMGEPLTHPYLSELLEIAANYSLQVNLTTNGILLEKAFDTLKKAKALRQLNISLHSYKCLSEHEIQDKLQVIRRFYEETSFINSRPYISLRLWNYRNISNMPDEFNQFVVSKIEKIFECTINNDEMFSERGIKIGTSIFLSPEQEFIWPELSHNIVEGRAFCMGLRDQAAILSNGSVVPCCLDRNAKIFLGNICNNSFSECVESERASALYKGFSEGICTEELCRRCSYRKRFTN